MITQRPTDPRFPSLLRTYYVYVVIYHTYRRLPLPSCEEPDVSKALGATWVVPTESRRKPTSSLVPIYLACVIPRTGGGPDTAPPAHHRLCKLRPERNLRLVVDARRSWLCQPSCLLSDSSWPDRARRMVTCSNDRVCRVSVCVCELTLPTSYPAQL